MGNTSQDTVLKSKTAMSLRFLVNQRLSKLFASWNQFVVPAVFLTIVIIFYSLDDKFLSPTNIINVLNQASILMVVAVGASLVIFAGGFDLSAGAVVALTGVAAGLVVEYTDSVSLGLAAGIFAGMVVGATNGIVVGHFSVSPLIATLGTLNVCRGFALVLASGSAIYSFPTWYTDFGTSRIFGLPSLFVVALIVFTVVGLMLRFTTFGISIYAVGGNSRAARLSGINDRAVRTAVFTLAGGITAIAGLMLCARTGGGEPTAGYLYELEAIAAVILGGAALSGGEGRLWRSMLGILLLAALGNGLNIVGVHPHWKGVAIGAILILAASVDRLKHRS